MVWREPIGGSVVKSAEERSAYFRAWDYRKKYGITIGDFDAMRVSQAESCAICIRPLARLDDSTGKPVRICVDHDHVTGAVRGLLCDPCNKGLGQFDDSPDRLRAAIAYLERHAKIDTSGD